MNGIYMTSEKVGKTPEKPEKPEKNNHTGIKEPLTGVKMQKNESMS